MGRGHNGAKSKMAAPMKKRAVDLQMGDSGDSDSGNENESMDDDSVDQVVQVEFEAHAPEGGDYEGIKQLLKQLFLKAHVDIGALTDIILQQNHVGSVIKQSELPEEDLSGDDDEVDDVLFGLTTVVNLTDKQDVPCIKQIINIVSEQCTKNGSDQVQKLVNESLKRGRNSEKHIGLIINERMVNIPPQIAAPLFENLSKEITAARDKNMPFVFDRFLMACKLYKVEGKSGKKSTSSIVFSKPEDEIFDQESLASFEYSIHGESDSGLDGDWDADDEGMKPFHRILVISSEKLDTIISRIRSTFVTPT